MFSGSTRGRGAATDAPVREFGAQQAPRARTQKNGTGRCPGFLRTREARIQSEKPHHLHEPTAKTPTEKRAQPLATLLGAEFAATKAKKKQIQQQPQKLPD